MTEPNIADKQPKIIEVKEGQTYAWCACGNSNNQPFCDGSHAGSEFTPKVFKAEKDESIAFCMCKHTKNAPRCDGTHATLDQD